ncbi:LuxR C-terminal-related transcriptional regulator [Nonlabens antarcticus]|uniref:LuxR C-terminal-related transcriptional regulator n=1 Tax=Nonlabens antarcticus TaxID=392714 RepID=UPI0018911A36|nr:LuxR C-terminal-related transcriptional regulator [Nonlabens antarcticus]
MAQNVSILYDETGELNLLDIPFESFETIESGYSNGLNRGVYWLQIDAVAEVSNFQLENNHIHDVQVYQSFTEVKTSNNNGFISFVLKPSTPVFVRLGVQKEAYFPFTIATQNIYERLKIQKAVGLGMFYGFALVVFLLNLGLFVTSRDKAFLYYSVFLVFILAVFAHRDGFAEILGMTPAVKDITEPLCLSIGGLMCAVFTVKSLRLHTHYPFIAFTYWGAAVISALFLSLYFALHDYAYVVGIYFVCLYIFVSSWLCSLLLIRVQRFAYIFCLAYFFMMITAILFYLGPTLNLQIFEVKQIHLKISAFVEMIIITFAIVYRMKTLDRKQRKMRKEMTQYLSEIAFLSDELEKNQHGQENIFTKFNLTNRENEILDLIADGKSNKQIADELFISINTVKYHVKKIYEKLEVSNRKEASKLMHQQELG